MTEKIYAFDMSNDEWVLWFKDELGQPRFRADQICLWIWQNKVFDAAYMTNFSEELRSELGNRVDFDAPELLKEQHSKIDGTRKYLWKFKDGSTVESVLLNQHDRLTACVSTQVGCPLMCSFCATGLSGYKRNLSAGEIAVQFLAMEKAAGKDISNIVYMGMGEPFLNTEEVLKSIKMLNSPKQRNLGIRHITVSTSGVAPGIIELAESGLGVRLAVSLHTADDELRSELMPINQTYPLSELRSAMTEYQKKTNDRITIEYALFGEVNDTVEAARELVRYLKGIHVYINLIPFNAVDSPFKKPKTEDVLRFRSILTTAGFEADIREERGADIDAACGQLSRKNADGAPAAFKPDTVKKEVKQVKYTAHSTAKRASGGFVEERHSRYRKTDKPQQERYRSGKMKEERPVYRGDTGEGTQTKSSPYKERGSWKAKEGRPSYKDGTGQGEQTKDRAYEERGKRGFGDKRQFDSESTGSQVKARYAKKPSDKFSFDGKKASSDSARGSSERFSKDGNKSKNSQGTGGTKTYGSKEYVRKDKKDGFDSKFSKTGTKSKKARQ